MKTMILKKKSAVNFSKTLGSWMVDFISSVNGYVYDCSEVNKLISLIISITGLNLQYQIFSHNNFTLCL